MTDDIVLLPFILTIDRFGKVEIAQNTLSNKDIARHLKFIASWVDSLPEEIGNIAPEELPQKGV